MSGLIDLDRSPSERVDVCVIGAGPAGALCAYSLARRGHDVLVIEAGRRFDFERRHEQMERLIRPSHTPAEVWEMGGDRDAFVSTGANYYPLNQRRVKGVGGSTLHWGGEVWRLHEKDFEMRSRYGLAEDWPIDYADLQPYYVAAEREIGVSGTRDNPFGPPRETDFPMPGFPPSYSDRLMQEACDELGIRTHSVPRAQASEPYDGRSGCVAYSTCSACPSGAKYTSEIHVRKARNEGARVIDRAPVQSIEHDETGEVVEAVVYATPDGTTHRQEARQFVLACGGVETPRLLLLSESDQYPDGLANSSGLVGRYLMEHPGIPLSGPIDDPTGQNMIGFNTTASQQFYEHEDPSPGSIIFRMWNNGGPGIIKTALLGGETNRRHDATDPFLGEEWGDDLLNTLDEQTRSYLRVSIAVEMLPDRSNRVTLDPSKTDDHDNPIPDLSLSVGPHAEEAMQRGIDIATDVLRKAGVEDVSHAGPDSPQYGGHHMGTTRMGTDPEESVVTPRLRTHDLDNLWIPSSSVFVTGGAVNPTLTIAALSLRAAEDIHEELVQ